jgi:hypothetical protein
MKRKGDQLLVNSDIRHVWCGYVPFTSVNDLEESLITCYGCHGWWTYLSADSLSATVLKAPHVRVAEARGHWRHARVDCYSFRLLWVWLDTSQNVETYYLQHYVSEIIFKTTHQCAGHCYEPHNLLLLKLLTDNLLRIHRFNKHLLKATWLFFIL